MIAIALWTSNIDEINLNKSEALRLGIQIKEEIKPIIIEREICFALINMQFAFLNETGNIRTIICGQEVVLKYDKKIHNRIKAHFRYI